MFLSDMYELTEGQKRMLVLADMTEGLPPERFNMDRIMSLCGTSGCVLGWAGVKGTFGDKLTYDEESGQLYLDGRLSVFAELNDEVRKFFDIDCYFDFCKLFGVEFGKGRSTPKTKAAQIRAYVKAQVAARVAA